MFRSIDSRRIPNVELVFFNAEEGSIGRFVNTERLGLVVDTQPSQRHFFSLSPDPAFELGISGKRRWANLIRFTVSYG